MKQNILSTVLIGLFALAFLAGPYGCFQSEDGWAGDAETTTTVAVETTTTSAVETTTTSAIATTTVATTTTVPADVGPGTHSGAVKPVATGSDPDVAVDSDGHLHFAYVRDGITWYKEFDYATGTDLSPERMVGGGDDPQIAVDNQGRAHVVFGDTSYTYGTGSGFYPAALLVSGLARGHIAVDQQDRAYVVGMRREEPRVKLYVIENGARIIDGAYLGQNDIGGIDVDVFGRVHACWRGGRPLFYSTYLLGEDVSGIIGRATVLPTPGSSDFSDIAVDDRDGSLHVVHTVAGGDGIGYVFRSGDGRWNSETFYAQNNHPEVPDDMGPTIDVDSHGYKYVVFTADNFIPHYFVIGLDGSAVINPTAIDPVLKSGGKKKNPNVASRPDMTGAYVTWGVGRVYVRSLGSAAF